MNSKMRTGRAMILLMIILFLSDNICAQDAYIHRLGMEGRAGYIFPTSSFLRGENDMRKIMRSACSAHLKYSFRLPPGTAADRIYGSSYQGIGLGYFDFGNRREWELPLPSTPSKAPASPESLPACRLTTNGGSAHLSAGSRMTISAIPTIL